MWDAAGRPSNSLNTACSPIVPIEHIPVYVRGANADLVALFEGLYSE